jgi:hypothetical protein
LKKFLLLVEVVNWMQKYPSKENSKAMDLITQQSAIQ